MTNYEQIIKWILPHEGPFSDDPNDPGGATAWGVILDDLRALGIDRGGDVNKDGKIDLADIRALAKDQPLAAALWKEILWDPYQYSKIQIPQVAAKLMDISMVTGSRQAGLCAQRALRACGYSPVEDGLIGPKSRALLNSLPEPDYWLVAMASETAGVFRMIAARRPTMGTDFLTGWLNRAYDIWWVDYRHGR